jgi:hypothetical protein
MKDVHIADFATAFDTAKGDREMEMKLYYLFNEEMRKAIRGRICTRDRMAKLYPIFREINIETDEIEREWAEFERKDKERAGKLMLKKSRQKKRNVE